MTDLCITCKENSACISNLSTERLTEVSECMYIYSLTCIIGSNRAQKPCRQREELLLSKFKACFGGIKATLH